MLSSRRAFEYHCAQKWVVGAPTPTGEIEIFVFAAYGSAFCDRSDLGALRKITVKAKIPIEYPLSSVGTGVLDGPKNKR